MADPVSIALGAQAGLSALNQLTEDDPNEKLIELQRQRYVDAAPFRTMGLARALQPLPQRPDLGAGFADPSNPFARTAEAPGFGEGYGKPMSFQDALGIETGTMRDRLSEDVTREGVQRDARAQMSAADDQRRNQLVQNVGGRREGESLAEYARRLAAERKALGF